VGEKILDESREDRLELCKSFTFRHFDTYKSDMKRMSEMWYWELQVRSLGRELGGITEIEGLFGELFRGPPSCGWRCRKG
jgi:hypothetical protein